MALELRQWGRRLKAEINALYLAYRDPRTPWAAKAIMALVLAYAVSPIDLIPDFIPVLGHLDDVILIPLGVALAIRLMPGEVWRDCRQRAQQHAMEKSGSSLGAAAVIVMIWVAAALVVYFLVRSLIR